MSSSVIAGVARPLRPQQWLGWVLVSAFTLLNLLNFIDRLLLSSFANEVIADLHLTYLEFSMLSSVLFSGFYAVSGITLGYLADRWRRLRIIALGSALWSTLTALTGLSTSLGQLVLARTFIGVGESALAPAALSALKDTLAPARLSLVTSVFYLGFPLGTGCSLILAGLLGPLLGWRGTFVLLGLLGLPLSVLVALLPEPARPVAGSLSPSERAGTLRSDVRTLLRLFREVSALGYLILASVFMQFSLGGLALEQVWLVRERGFGIHRAQLLFGTVYTASATIALILGGVLADGLRNRRSDGRFHALLFSTLFLVPTLAFRLVSPESGAFYPLAIAASMFACLTIGPYYALIQELAPTNVRATVFALVLLITTIAGFALGSACFGYLSSWLQARGAAAPLTLSYLVFNSAGLLSVPMILLALRSHRRARLPHCSRA